MGAAGSSNVAPPPSAPLRPRSEETFIYGTEESCCPEYTNENIRQRTRASAFDVGEEPRSQLTYAAQMTDWQTAEGHSPSFSHQHQEAMELSRAITQLAVANQQLASAHTATLAHLEELYIELRKERQLKKRDASSDEARRRRLTIEQDLDDEEPRDEKLRSKIERLEQLAKNSPDRVLNDVPERESKSRLETTNDEAWRTSVRRVHTASDETVNLHLEKSDRVKSRIEDEPDRTKSTGNQEVITLSEEIERLKAERSEIRYANERLTSELAEQKATVQNLTESYEASKARHEEVESSLQERKREYDELSRKLDVATQETDRLLKEIDAFNAQKDTAEARIVSLEQDLQMSLLEKEQIKSIENQKTLKLKAQLSEEVSDKKKQIKALEEALDEIQRLKETIKTERKNDDDDEDVDDPEGSLATDRTTNIEDFKKELTLKREARQRAITAVSSEMERLRRELDAEKEAHSETSRVLDLVRSAQNDPRAQQETGEADGNLTRTRTKDSKPDEHELETKRVEAQRLTSVLKVSDELRNDIRFQMEKLDNLRYHLETEPDQHRYRIRCLAEVTNKTRESVYARERRANELKDHLAQILVRLGDRSFLDLKDDVALECERQLENINSLKSLYNERLKVLTELKDAAIRELVDVKERLDHTLEKSECLEEDLKKADEKIDVQDTEISNLESQLGLTKADCRDLQNQMSLINGLFTQMLLGASSADMDLDRLTQLLQENHDLISDIAREESTEAAALPKLLLDLVEQVEGSKGTQKRADGENSGETDVEAEKKEDDLQQEDIAHNLPKVWRVLLELLSCHAEGSPSAAAASAADPNSCYKSVDTPAGPRLVISVSKTYIRLKELILEKKHLEKEMNRMKQLNTHLESKLGEQEKRLSAVSAELSKTWTIVDRMQAQHQQLHTHEKILRYELQEKRKMLQELKQELEYCREKWESARQKNTNTELEWRCLRREFAARKALAVHDSFNNSAESGFSDERGDDTDEEDDAVEGRLRLGPRRKPRKESPRAPSPDTESEQPTDTELSEPKTGSSATLEQRTSTPETETELDETEASNETLNVVSVIATEAPQSVSEGSQESLDPLDQALTNVIQNLIAINEPGSTTFASPIVQVDVAENVANDDSSFLESFHTIDSNLECNEAPCDGDPLITNDSIVPEISVQDFDLPSGINENCQKTTDPEGEKTNIEKSTNLTESHAPTVTSIVSTLPVFSIGPFPMPVVTPTIVKNVQFTDTTIDGPSNRCFAPVFGAPLTEERFESNASQETESRGLEKRGTRSTEGVVDSDSVSIDSSSSLETVKEFSASSLGETGKTESSEVGSSKQEENKVKTRTPEEALAAREDRLRRLEEQAKWLMNKMNATSRRGSVLSTRLEELHEAYGEPPVPPPMPDVLPSRRLQTNLTDLPRQVPESPVAEGTENSNTPVSSGGCNESSPDNAP
ncbi:cytadherence high molecular weight protein 2 isoform X2 [Colletes gigas]|uniref:cytadherence high molecular weight protein 2 isoform X2 n=1 Tax=Colletes gigas TaxID=935657 RepID=UPI001C9A7DC5|nr:cytadherence high molecular weight protein 2 isoform X2 [Colletes gigas]